jgi:hypothetical protein
MNNKTLGTLALAGAPFLSLGVYLEELYPTALHDSWFTGACGLVYISGWSCSMIAMQRLEATGKNRFGKAVLRVILAMLLLANFSNMYQLLFPQDKSMLFWTLDVFWPLSNLMMLVVGIAVVMAKGLPGWRRYVPLAVGLWLPTALLTVQLFGRTAPVFLFGSAYSVIAWTLLAVAVLTAKEKASGIASSQKYQLS